MKFRIGFVSNSSSSSFVILKSKLTKVQIDLIQNHVQAAKTIDYLKECACSIDDLNFEWNIKVEDEIVTGYVDMDNFSMRDFLSLIGVPDEHIIWGD